MPRTKQQYEAMRKATQEKIQAAAIKLFTEKGLAATSVRDIADNAGISTGLMYRHYKTKDELYGSIVLEAANGLGEVICMFQSDAQPREIMEAFTQEVVHDLSNDDEFARFMVLVTQAVLSEDVLPEVHILLRQNKILVEEMACLIKKGQALGQFRQGDPYSMALYYFSAIQGLAETKFILKERFVTPEPEIVNAFLIKGE